MRQATAQEVPMKTRTILIIAASFVFASTATAQEAGQPKGKTPPKTSAASRLVAKPAAEMKWSDLDPTGAPGVKVADLWGDHTKGAFGAYFKLPAGFAVPLHTHTHDMKVIFVSGTYIQAPEGKPEFRLGPGSYMMQPGGNYRHTTSCDKSSECLFFVESNGPFDLKIVDAPKPGGKHP
jgi:anti-sigma factor ChrR (cupin superfamily)